MKICTVGTNTIKKKKFGGRSPPRGEAHILVSYSMFDALVMFLYACSVNIL